MLWKKILIIMAITGLLISNVIGLYSYTEQGKENSQLQSDVEGYKREVKRLNNHNEQLTQFVDHSTAKIEELETSIKENKNTIHKLKKELDIKK